jgi:hypothetical protein
MKRIFGIAFVSILIVLLAAIAIPNFVNPKTVPAQNVCVRNLRQLDAAKQQWALEYHKTTNDVASMQDLLPYLKGPFKCPDGGTYVAGRVGESPMCSKGGRHKLPE